MMRKTARCATFWLLLLICGACNGVPAELCLDFEGGGCSGQNGVGQQGYQIFIAGFPIDRVDQTPIAGTDGYRGTLTVGDTVSFRAYVVFSDRVSSDGATDVYVRTWALADSSVGSVSRQDDGTGRVVAIGPGKLLPLVANEAPYTAVYACNARNVCRKVTDIVVVQ